MHFTYQFTHKKRTIYASHFPRSNYTAKKPAPKGKKKAIQESKTSAQEVFETNRWAHQCVENISSFIILHAYMVPRPSRRCILKENKVVVCLCIWPKQQQKHYLLSLQFLHIISHLLLNINYKWFFFFFCWVKGNWSGREEGVMRTRGPGDLTDGSILTLHPAKGSSIIISLIINYSPIKSHLTSKWQASSSSSSCPCLMLGIWSYKQT